MAATERQLTPEDLAFLLSVAIIGSVLILGGVAWIVWWWRQG